MRRLDLLRYFAPIAARLSSVEAELQRMLESDVSVVRKLAEHVREGKGKRLRPALLLMASRFCGVSSDEDIRFGAVFELIHSATLVHDDVIDNSSLRRSQPTLNALWGNTLTVLFGDLLYLEAVSSAIRGRNWRLLEILADVTIRMIEGELIQHDCLYKLDTSRADYFEIQERKTALLFGACAECAAVLAGRPQQDCDALRSFGMEIGRAFQLVDDLLDYTATREQLGKPVFSDLREGKLTLPMLELLERAPGEARPLVEKVWREGRGLSEKDEWMLRDLLQRHDALAETRARAQQASRLAAEAIWGVEGDSATKKLLLEIPDVLLDRSR